MTAIGRGSDTCRFSCASLSCMNARRLEMPVSESTKAAVLWRYSVRSFAIAKRMNAIEIVNSSASKLSTVSHTLSNTELFAGDDDRIALNGVRNR